MICSGNRQRNLEERRNQNLIIMKLERKNHESMMRARPKLPNSPWMVNRRSSAHHVSRDSCCMWIVRCLENTSVDSCWFGCVSRVWFYELLLVASMGKNRGNSPRVKLSFRVLPPCWQVLKSVTYAEVMCQVP